MTSASPSTPAAAQPSTSAAVHEPDDDELHGQVYRGRRWEQCQSQVLEGAGLGFGTWASSGALLVGFCNFMSPNIARLPTSLKVFGVMAFGTIGFAINGDQAEVDCARRLSLAHINAKRAAQGRPPLRDLESFQ